MGLAYLNIKASRYFEAFYFAINMIVIHTIFSNKLNEIREINPD